MNAIPDPLPWDAPYKALEDLVAHLEREQANAIRNRNMPKQRRFAAILQSNDAIYTLRLRIAHMRSIDMNNPSSPFFTKSK